MFEMDINTKSDQMKKNGEISPMIIVCPRIENSRGLKSSLTYREVGDSGKNTINLEMYEDYLINEVITLVEKTSNCIKDKKGRYIGGISGGGYAALHNAFRHQQIFSKVGGHMPAVELKLEEEDKAYYKDMDMWNKYDPIYIAKNNYISTDVHVFLDAGDRDEGRFYEGCSVLHGILKEKCVNSQNYIFHGNHSGEYIKSNIEKYFKFYGYH